MQQLLYINIIFFDIGLFFPKASVLAFYWRLFPPVCKKLRRALYCSIAYLVVGLLVTIFVDIFGCWPISANWYVMASLILPIFDLEANPYIRTSPIIGKPLYENKAVFITTYFFNLSTGLIVFILPFFLLPNLQLRHRQKLSVFGIFSLGLITIIMSVTRFAIFISVHYHLGPASESMCSPSHRIISLTHKQL